MRQNPIFSTSVTFTCAKYRIFVTFWYMHSRQLGSSQQYTRQGRIQKFFARGGRGESNINVLGVVTNIGEGSGATPRHYVTALDAMKFNSYFTPAIPP